MMININNLKSNALHNYAYDKKSNSNALLNYASDKKI